MYRPRVIPALLLKNKGLVKTVKFKKSRYIGDPINAVKIFNDLRADELVFLDITASSESRKVSLDFVKNVGAEANMPFSVGGGIKSVSDIKEIINAGAEKVVLNTHAYLNPSFVKDAVNEFGSSTIVVSIDVKKKFLKGQQVYIYGGTKSIGEDPVEYAKKIEDLGAGEIILNSIDNDGMMSGYDIDLVKKVSNSLSIPVVALGGAGSLQDIEKVIEVGYASAASAGSLFVYHGPRNAVLINYPTKEELKKLTYEDFS
ncbi:AglZ/HisF2 family acetamidino modification protein [Pseudotenacibaculum haliotis]|uniref:imidazole glycerol-phosphate synthase n=1 Tax=Pseudotenacibaculum haliotis TaxID=1862138 RepID=A0ABW5LUK4_9FLAO